MSEISPNGTLSVLVGVAEWFNAVSKVSAESQTQGLILATQVAFSKIISLSSRTCFFRPWQIKCCMLSCQQIEILIQIEKPVHVSRIELKIQISFMCGCTFNRKSILVNPLQL